jgi:hypothetical protein
MHPSALHTCSVIRGLSTFLVSQLVSLSCPGAAQHDVGLVRSRDTLHHDQGSLRRCAFVPKAHETKPVSAGRYGGRLCNWLVFYALADDYAITQMRHGR